MSIFLLLYNSHETSAALDEMRRACPKALVIILIGTLTDRQQAALSTGADVFISTSELPERVAEHLRCRRRENWYLMRRYTNCGNSECFHGLNIVEIPAGERTSALRKGNGWRYPLVGVDQAHYTDKCLGAE